jgi:tetratricopeptide (TPR) repeat protein
LAMTLPYIPMQGQRSASDQIVEAERLRSQGGPKAAIAILEPMVQAPVNGMAESELGMAWNILGSSYQDLKMPDKARSCYETAIEILRPILSAQANYAAAIANLGTLEDSEGQKDAAMALYKKSSRIYESLGDSGGVTVTSTSMAMLAFTQTDFKAARRYLARALEEAQRTPGLRDGDIAAVYAMRSALALHDGRAEEAISTIDQSIDRWTHAHGPDYFTLGLGYALRAQAIAKVGDYGRALSDVQHGLAILETAEAKNTAAYFRVEIVYAEILRASGEKEEASRLKKEASSALAGLEARRCNGCTIDASGFR